LALVADRNDSDSAAKHRPVNQQPVNRCQGHGWQNLLPDKSY